jgi:hypothetical protein
MVTLLKLYKKSILIKPLFSTPFNAIIGADFNGYQFRDDFTPAVF